MKKYFIILILICLTIIATVLWLTSSPQQAESKFDLQALIAQFSDYEFKKDTPGTKIILGGDVMLGRSVEQTSKAHNDFDYPFLQIASYLQSADIVFVNLENPIVENCPPRTSGLVFCANPQMLSGLNYAGVNIVNLANNHTFNYGQAGLDSTQKYLTQNNIGYTGLGKLYVFTINKTKFGFLGFNRAESAKLLTEPELDLVKRSDSQVDVLIVAMHWGTEYKDMANIYQRQIAKQLVENGADVVVGHHPHWVQDREMVNGKPVFYSLGNLVFDQMWSEKTKQGMLVELTFKGSEIINQKFINIYIDKLGQPILVN